MTSVSKTYTIGKLKQLIDLNEDSVNFKTEFKVTSTSPFDMAVVDQTALDSNEFEYKHVTTEEISGNVKNDKNIYQNYFMILKADTPTEVQVFLDKQEIDPAVEPNSSTEKEVGEVGEYDCNDKTAMYIIIAIIICACLVGGYYYFNSSSDKKKEKVLSFQAPLFANDSNNPFEKSSNMSSVNNSSSSIDFRSPEKSSSFFNSSSVNSSNGSESSSSSAGSFLKKIRARNNNAD